MQYSFSFGHSQEGSIRLDANSRYDEARGFGFAQSPETSRNEDLRDSWPGDYFLPAVPTFLIDVPYGNYEITILLGNEAAPACTTVKAGLGHVMLHEVKTEAGQLLEEKFAVHVEDGQLKLAFAGPAPGVRQLRIERAAGMPTLFLAGDSTVTDQPSGGFPYAGWGQMIGKFLTHRIAVSNHARSGRSSKSFIDESRLNRIVKKLKPADILLVQFAHNDEKDNEGGTEPFTTYPAYLKRYIDAAREAGAHPVLVSPMHRRFFEEDGTIRNTHGEYIEAMRRLAEQEAVPYVDLAGASKRLYEELGEEPSKSIFMWAEPGQYPGLPEGAQDNTHFCEAGGFAIAALVAEGIRKAAAEPLAGYLR